MKVVHVMTSQRGGAARAAYRLHDALCHQGMDSMVYAKDAKISEGGKIHGFRAERDMLSRAMVRLKKYRIEQAYRAFSESRPAGLEIYSDDRAEYGDQVFREMPQCDIIHLHWIAQFVDYSSFFRLVRQPIVWTLHDMNPFTGGCHYDGGCGRFKEQCGVCPQLGSTYEDDLSRAIWHRKAKAFSSISEGRLHIVTPSKWLQKEAQASALFRGLPVSVIPYGLNTKVFSPREATGFRSALNIPEGAKVVLFVADSVANKRKGAGLLMLAMQQMPSAKSLFFISIGSGNIKQNLPNHIHLGGISSDLLMSIAYSVADVFVIPSLEDNLPNTVLESIACGTPVIGFDRGGIPDMVRPGQTGELVEAENIGALRDTIARLLQDRQKLEAMSRECRNVAVEEYDERIQADRYRDLYFSINHPEKGYEHV